MLIPFLTILKKTNKQGGDILQPKERFVGRITYVGDWRKDGQK